MELSLRSAPGPLCGLQPFAFPETGSWCQSRPWAGAGASAMALRKELLKSIWYAFTALDVEKSGKVSKSQLKVRGIPGAQGRLTHRASSQPFRESESARAAFAEPQRQRSSVDAPQRPQARVTRSHRPERTKSPDRADSRGGITRSRESVARPLPGLLVGSPASCLGMYPAPPCGFLMALKKDS